ncbi:MAG TPA: hypothetical protein VFS07_08325 [Gemmatimonadales bacterium]|nr:hypothetical protein [Gemmatimonadales bacterium]
MRVNVLAVLAVALVGVVPRAGRAQRMPPGADTSSAPPQAATSFGLGVQALDVDALNAALRAGGFPTMSSTALVSGLATELRFGRWDLSFSGGGILAGAKEGAVWRTQASGRALMVGVGYTLLQAGRWRVTPAAGAGLARVGYRIEQVRGGSVDSVLADPLRGTALDGQTALWHASIGVGYRLGGRRAMGVGARLGYARPFGHTDWRADRNDLSDGPRASYGGLFARLGMSVGIPRRKDAVIPALVSVVPWIAR